MTSTSADRRLGVNSGMAIKVPCRVATTAAITLSGEQTIDGVACVTGDRVLVKDQASGVDNGIYEADTGSWERTTDFDGTYDCVQGTMVEIVSGTTNGNKLFVLTTASPVIGTTSLAFSAILSLGSFPISVGNGGTGASTAATARAALGAGDASQASIQTQSYTKFTAGGTADAITGALAPVIAAYATGMRITTTPPGANTITAPTINLSTLGAKKVFKRDSSGSAVALAAGDYNASGPFDFQYDATLDTAAGGWVLLNPLSSVSSKQIQSISASVAVNALTISASSLSLDFRSTTLTSGTVTTVSGTPSNLVISSGSTLGTVNGVQSRIAVLALNNSGTIELAAVNVAGGVDLTETGLISTTAEGGAGAADSASVVYSTTARTSLAYRVIGYIESTQATAGTWATAPSTIQGVGGQAWAAMASLGYGQTWQDVKTSPGRSTGTTYYNTTGKPIVVSLVCSAVSNTTVTVNGNVLGYLVANALQHFIVPPGGSYVISTAGTTVTNWFELR